MIGLLQRVSRAGVAVDGVDIGVIGAGLLVLLCAERGDSEQEADRLLSKLLAYRVFSDAAGKMNLSLTQTGGGLLLVPQFTLAADTNSGTRPSFQPAPRRPTANGCSIISSPARRPRIRWCRPAASAPTCRSR